MTPFLALCLACSLMALSSEDPAKKTDVSAVSSKNDSITSWIHASKNTSFSLEQRKQFLVKAYHYVTSSHEDSVQARTLNTIAYRNLKLGDTALFKKQTNEGLSLATRQNDSFAMGDAHWNYASYYNEGHVFDSAYHHFNAANSFFEKSGHTYESAKMQYGMAFIKGRFKDYSGSEVLIFMAIKKSHFSMYLNIIRNVLLPIPTILFANFIGGTFKTFFLSYCLFNWIFVISLLIFVIIYIKKNLQS